MATEPHLFCTTLLYQLEKIDRSTKLQTFSTLLHVYHVLWYHRARWSSFALMGATGAMPQRWSPSRNWFIPLLVENRLIEKLHKESYMPKLSANVCASPSWLWLNELNGLNGLTHHHMRHMHLWPSMRFRKCNFTAVVRHRDADWQRAESKAQRETLCGLKSCEAGSGNVGKQISKLIPHLPCHSNAQLHHDVRISVSQQLAACGPVSSVFLLCQFGAEKSLKLGYSKWAKCFQVLTVGDARKGKRAGFWVKSNCFTLCYRNISAWSPIIHETQPVSSTMGSSAWEWCFCHPSQSPLERWIYLEAEKQLFRSDCNLIHFQDG